MPKSFQFIKGRTKQILVTMVLSLYSLFSIEFSKKRCIVVAYLEINGILCDSQCGFREKHSTEHALIGIVNKIQSHSHKGMISCGVFIDLKKSF